MVLAAHNTRWVRELNRRAESGRLTVTAQHLGETLEYL